MTDVASGPPPDPRRAVQSDSMTPGFSRYLWYAVGGGLPGVVAGLALWPFVWLSRRIWRRRRPRPAP